MPHGWREAVTGGICGTVVLRSRSKSLQASQSWRAIIRKKGELLGFIDATDTKAAEAAAVRLYRRDVERRKRLIIPERA